MRLALQSLTAMQQAKDEEEALAERRKAEWLRDMDERRRVKEQKRASEKAIKIEKTNQMRSSKPTALSDEEVAFAKRRREEWLRDLDERRRAKERRRASEKADKETVVMGSSLSTAGSSKPPVSPDLAESSKRSASPGVADKKKARASKAMGAIVQLSASPDRKSLVSKAMTACDSGNATALAALLNEGIDVNAADVRGWSLLLSTLVAGHAECAKVLLAAPGIKVNQQTADGFTPLYLSAQKDQTECMRLLLAAPGIKVNQPTADGFTPLYLSAQKGQTECVQLLLAVPGIMANQPEANGATPLYISAEKGQTACMRLLLASPGIEVNQPMNDGTTPLLISVQEGQTECVRLLLAAPGIEVNRPGTDGATPLIVACATRATAAALVLLDDPRTDINAVHLSGATALSLAYDNDNEQLVAALISRGSSGEYTSGRTQQPWTSGYRPQLARCAAEEQSRADRRALLLRLRSAPARVTPFAETSAEHGKEWHEHGTSQPEPPHRERDLCAALAAAIYQCVPEVYQWLPEPSQPLLLRGTLKVPTGMSSGQVDDYDPETKRMGQVEISEPAEGTDWSQCKVQEQEAREPNPQKLASLASSSARAPPLSTSVASSSARAPPLSTKRFQRPGDISQTHDLWESIILATERPNGLPPKQQDQKQGDDYVKEVLNESQRRAEIERLAKLQRLRANWFQEGNDTSRSTASRADRKSARGRLYAVSARWDPQAPAPRVYGNGNATLR